jgi:Fe2+ or Zn2+ uptake regulation protein
MRQLAALGEIAAVEDLGSSGRRYDTNAANHHHLACLSCREIVDVEREFGGLDLPEGAAGGYFILKSQVTFYGLCPDCRKK